MKKTLLVLTISLILKAFSGTSAYAGLLQEQFGDLNAKKNQTFLYNALKKNLDEIDRGSYTGAGYGENITKAQPPEELMTFFTNVGIRYKDIAFIDTRWNREAPTSHEGFDDLKNCSFRSGYPSKYLQKLFNIRYNTLMRMFNDISNYKTAGAHLIFAVARNPKDPDKIYLASCTSSWGTN